ncbi:hypothetical protein [Paenibacillus harenae]|uniref:hypothetical protein n=1 Tax=Paenibacillus harenae TaxID=306543 RepID=UPI00048E6F44|nr:hypothetical protein [Paenibacillus harenae]
MSIRLKDFRGIFIIVLIILLIVGGRLIYDFTKKPPQPTLNSIRMLTHSDNVEKIGHINSNLIKVLSPFLYGYLIQSENEEPYLLVVERSYGRNKDASSYYFKMSKMIEMSLDEKESKKELLIHFQGKSILGKNEVSITEKDTTIVKTFYKIDTGDQIILTTESMDYYIKNDDNKYDILRTF